MTVALLKSPVVQPVEDMTSSISSIQTHVSIELEYSTRLHLLSRHCWGGAIAFCRRKSEWERASEKERERERVRKSKSKSVSVSVRQTETERRDESIDQRTVLCVFYWPPKPLSAEDGSHAGYLHTGTSRNHTRQHKLMLRSIYIYM